MFRQSGRELSESDIPIYPLATTTQQDPNSCGLFALNAVGYYYFEQDSPLLQPDALSVAHYWMEIALGLLHRML